MIHIIGANGYIGTKLQAYFYARNIVYDAYSDVPDENCRPFDLTSKNFDSLPFASGDVVILLAAISSPDVCQNNYEFAYSINVEGTARFISFCSMRGVKVIFMSSDAVNGDTGIATFDEYAHVNPFGNYAKMKYEIETKFSSDPNFKALRLSYVWSREDKFSKYLASCCEKGEVAEVFDGLYRNVIPVEIVLEAIYSLSQNFDFNDFYLTNVSGNQCLSRKDLALVYQKTVDPSLRFKLVSVPEPILKGRPNIIRTKSLFLVKLLGHEIVNLL